LLRGGRIDNEPGHVNKNTGSYAVKKKKFRLARVSTERGKDNPSEEGYAERDEALPGGYAIRSSYKGGRRGPGECDFHDRPKFTLKTERKG